MFLFHDGLFAHYIMQIKISNVWQTINNSPILGIEFTRHLNRFDI